MKTWIVGLALVASSAVFAADVWTVRELKVAQNEAIELFRARQGETLYKAIEGLAIERSAQGTSGRAKITYTQGGVKKSVTYFCHYHEGAEIDCH